MFPFFFNHPKKENEKDDEEKETTNSTKEKQEKKSLFPFTPSLFQNKSPIFETAKKVNQNQQSPSRKPIPLSCNVMTAKASPSVSRNSTGTLAFLKNEAKTKFIFQNKHIEKGEHINNKEKNSQIINETEYHNQSDKQYEQKPEQKEESDIGFLSNQKINSKKKLSKKELKLLSTNTDINKSFNAGNNNKVTRKTQKINKNVPNKHEIIPEKLSIRSSIEMQAENDKSKAEYDYSRNHHINLHEIPIQFHTKTAIMEPPTVKLEEIHTDNTTTYAEPIQAENSTINSEIIQEGQSLIPIKKTTQRKKEKNIIDMVALDVSSDSSKSDDLDDTYSSNNKKINHSLPNKTKNRSKKEEKNNYNYKTLKSYGFLNVKTRSQSKTIYNPSEVNSLRFYVNKPFVYYNDNNFSDNEIEEPIKKSRKRTNQKIKSNNENLNKIINLEESKTIEENQIPQICQVKNEDLTINSQNLETNQQINEEIEDKSQIVQESPDQIENMYFMSDDNQPLNSNEQENEKTPNNNINNDNNDKINKINENDENEQNNVDQNINISEKVDQIEVENEIPLTETTTISNNISNEEESTNKEKLNLPIYPSKILNQISKERESQKPLSQPLENTNLGPKEPDSKQNSKLYKYNPSKNASQIYIRTLSKYLNNKNEKNNETSVTEGKTSNSHEKDQNTIKNETENSNDPYGEFADYVDSPVSSDFQQNDKSDNDQTPKSSISTPNLSNVSTKNRQFIFPHPLSQSPSTLPFEQFLKKRTKISEEDSMQSLHSIPNSQSVDNSFKSFQKFPSNPINTTEKAINRLLEMSKNMNNINSDDENDGPNSKNSRNSFIPPFFKENQSKPISLLDNEDENDTSKYNEFERAIFSAGKKSKWQIKKSNNSFSQYVPEKNENDYNNYYNNDDDEEYQPPHSQKDSIHQTKKKTKNKKNTQKSTKKSTQKVPPVNVQPPIDNQIVHPFDVDDNELEIELENAVNEIKKDESLMKSFENQQDKNDASKTTQKTEPILPKFKPKKIFNSNSKKKDDDDLTLGMVINEMIKGKKKKTKVNHSEISEKHSMINDDEIIPIVNDNRGVLQLETNQQNSIANENQPISPTNPIQQNSITNETQQNFASTTENKEILTTNANQTNPTTNENQTNPTTNENQTNPTTNENQTGQTSQVKKVNHPRKKIIEIISTEKLNEMQKFVDKINNEQSTPQFEPDLKPEFEKKVMETNRLFEKSLKPMSQD